MIGLFDSPWPRRSFLMGAAAIGAALAQPGIVNARPGRGAAHNSALLPALDDAAENVRLYVKISGDLSGKPFARWWSGHFFALDEGKMTQPLCAIEGFGHGWTKPRPDGSFKSAWRELGFYKDHSTGEILDHWRNPLTDEVCEVMHVHNRYINADLRPSAPTAPVPAEPGTRIGDYSYSHDGDASKPFILPWFVQGKTLSVSLDLRYAADNPLDPVQWRRESSGSRISVTDFVMHTAQIADVLDGRLTSAPSVGYRTQVGAWLPWMLMGPATGQLLLRGTSRKLASLHDVPQPLRRYAATRFPEFLGAPTEADFERPSESSWSVYARERKPWQLDEAEAT